MLQVELSRVSARQSTVRVVRVEQSETFSMGRKRVQPGGFKPKQILHQCASPSCPLPHSATTWSFIYRAEELAAATAAGQQTPPPVPQSDGHLWRITGGHKPSQEMQLNEEQKSDMHRFVTVVLPEEVTASGEPQLVCHSGYQVRTPSYLTLFSLVVPRWLLSASPTLFSEASVTL
jgi:hypothetical protein